ncbi:hypothetical protein KIPB_016410, partial [Kipferlia bialata]
KGIKYLEFTQTFESYGATYAQGLKEGQVTIYCSKMGKIYGALVVGNHSGELINELSLAMTWGIRMHKLAFRQGSFPTVDISLSLYRY